MANNIKILVIIVIVFIVIVSGYFIFRKQKSLPNNIVNKPTSHPAATGNVDDAVNAFMQETTNENTEINDEDKDTNLLMSSSQEVSDFGNLINANEY